MLRHNNLLTKFILKTVLVLGVYTCTLADTGNEKSITVLLGCDAQDALHDIVYSVEGIKKIAEKNNIKIKFNSNDKRCGYLFFGSIEKYISGVLTDYDLSVEMKIFFKLK